MFGRDKRVERRNQQAREVEASQKALRDSIAETERLVDQSEKMLSRHRKDWEDDENGAEPS